MRPLLTTKKLLSNVAACMATSILNTQLRCGPRCQPQAARGGHPAVSGGTRHLPEHIWRATRTIASAHELTRICLLAQSHSRREINVGHEHRSAARSRNTWMRALGASVHGIATPIASCITGQRTSRNAMFACTATRGCLKCCIARSSRKANTATQSASKLAVAQLLPTPHCSFSYTYYLLRSVSPERPRNLCWAVEGHCRWTETGNLARPGVAGDGAFPLLH
jgi:hypothetical protein